MEDLDRLPPQAIAAEAEVLGAMLIDKDAVDVALSILTAADFYGGKHKTIFATAAALYERDQGLDQALLREELAAKGQLEEIGGVAYLADLAAAVATSAHVEQLARIVKDRSLCRQLIAAGTDLVRTAFEPGRQAPELAATFAAQLSAVEEVLAGGTRSETIADVLRELFASLDGERLPAYKTGLLALDQATGGMMPGELVVIMGRRGEGKSTLGVQLLRTWAGQGIPGLICSYEMSREQLSGCLLAAEAHLVIRKDWQLTVDARAAANNAADVIAPLPLHVDDDSTRKLSALLATCRQRSRKNKCRAFLIDYIQLVPADKERDTREQDVAATSRGLKLLARELKSVVIACSQINDQGLSRESRAIENDADMLIRISAPDPETSGPVVTAQLIVKKNRSGACGTVNATWHKGWRLFTDYCPPAGGGMNGELA